MWDNTVFWLVGRFNPGDWTKKSWKYFNFSLSGQKRRRIKRNKNFLLMEHARILFCSNPVQSAAYFSEWKFVFNCRQDKSSNVETIKLTEIRASWSIMSCKTCISCSESYWSCHPYQCDLLLDWFNYHIALDTSVELANNLSNSWRTE
jgi:hypothetical protein